MIAFLSNYLEGFQLFAIGFYGFTLYDASLILFTGFIAIDLFWYGKKIYLADTNYLKLYFLLMGSILLSSYFSLITTEHGRMMQFFKSYFHLFFTSLFGLYMILSPRSSQEWSKIIRILLIASIFINIFGIYQIVARFYDLPFAWLKLNNASFTVRGTAAESAMDLDQISLRFQGFFRATSIFVEPSRLAQFNLIIFIFLVIPFLKRQKMFIKSKFINIIIFISFTIASFLTFSLTFLSTLVLLVLAVFILEKRKPIKPLLLALLLTGSVVAVADIAVRSYAEISVLNLFSKRITGALARDTYKSQHTPGESTETRYDNIMEAYYLWLDHPIIGIGWGQKAFYSDRFIFTTSAFFQILSEAGLLGIVSWIIFLLFVFLKTLKFIKKSQPKFLDSEQVRVNGTLAYILIYIVYNNIVTGALFSMPDFWALIGFIMSAVIISENNSEKELYTIRMIRVPLRERFSKNIRAYLEK